MNTTKFLETLADRVREIGIREVARRAEIAATTLSGIMQRPEVILTVSDAARIAKVVGLKLTGDNDGRWFEIAATRNSDVRFLAQRGKAPPKKQQGKAGAA